MKVGKTRAVVVYNSKTGFTKKYAEWIAEELGCEMQPYKSLSESTLSENDIVIFGSRVHAGRIEQLAKVKKRLAGLPGKTLVVFATGATPLAAENVITKIWADNFSSTEMKSIPHFYMQSGLDYDKMGLADRAVMKMAAKLMSGESEKSDEESGFAQAITGSHDISSKEYIAPLVDYVRKALGNSGDGSPS